MADYGVFRTGDARRIARATRIVEGNPRTYLKYPQQIANRWGGGTTTPDDNDDFPPNADPCNCNNCQAGTTLVDGGEECCESHLQWSLTNPWLTCETTELLLEYVAGGSEWITEPFTGPEGNANTYRWHLIVDVDGLLAGVPQHTYLKLEIETDNGGPEVCIEYGRDGFDCLCANALTIKKPFGRWHGVERSDLSCNVCLQPYKVNELCTGIACQLGSIVKVELPDIFTANCAPDCANLAGVHYLSRVPRDPDPFTGIVPCEWKTGLIDLGVGCDAPHTCYAFLTLVVTHGTNNLRLTLATGCECSTQFSVGNASQTFWEISIFDLVCDDGSAELPFLEHRWRGPDTCDPEMPETCTYDTEGSHATVFFFSDDLVAATRSGACADVDCTPPVAPPDPPGACCIEGGCHGHMEETACNEFGGVWYADEGTCDEECSPSGACCIQDGGNVYCITGNSYLCGLYGGSLAVGGDCDDDPCDDVGACCRSDGGCELSLEADCTGNDHWYGVGTDCTGKDCLGACCCDADVCCYGDTFTYDDCQTIGAGGAPPDPACGGAVTFLIDGTCLDCSGGAASC